MKLEMTGTSDGYECKIREGMKTTQNLELMISPKKKVSGIITIKPHRHDDSKGIVLDFIIMAVLDKNNDIYK